MDQTITLADCFPRSTAPETGWMTVQLTSGAGFCYPLYYFIPSISRDNRYLIYHRAINNTVQLHRLDLTTGDSVQLTHAASPDAQWQPWCTDPGSGVLDHRSVLSVARDTVIYFEGTRAYAVDIHTQETRLLFELPPDRWPIGQNCVSPDGAWFIYIHHDKALYEQIYGPCGSDPKGGYSYPRHLSRATKLAGYNLDTGEHRTIITLNSPIHHVQPYGDHHLAFSSLAVERAILLTDYQGGWYTHLRTQSADGYTTCHYCATESGIIYEADSAEGLVGGVVFPESHQTVEFALPGGQQGGAHIGFDASGKHFFFERNLRQQHDIQLLVRRDPANGDLWQPLVGHWHTYGSKQKSHFHPRLVLNDEWIMMVGGDPASASNHIFLLDAHDLPAAEGIYT